MWSVENAVIKTKATLFRSQPPNFKTSFSVCECLFPVLILFSFCSFSSGLRRWEECSPSAGSSSSARPHPSSHCLTDWKAPLLSNGRDKVLLPKMQCFADTPGSRSFLSSAEKTTWTLTYFLFQFQAFFFFRLFCFVFRGVFDLKWPWLWRRKKTYFDPKG